MKIHSVGGRGTCSESEFVFVIIKVASSSLGREGRYSRFGSSPASPLHDAQNWPTPEHQSSLHDASSTPPLLPNLLWAWLLFGAWPARSLFFSLSRPEAPACRFEVAGLPVIRNNSPSPLGILVLGKLRSSDGTVRWSPFRD